MTKLNGGKIRYVWLVLDIILMLAIFPILLYGLGNR